MVVHAYNPGIWKAEVGDSWVQDQPGLLSETLSQKNKTGEVAQVVECLLS
jgi:hypothetical protein